MLTGTIELKHLRTFLAVAEERSFGRAATGLGYTQSAVSQQIAALERAVGLPVFHRPGGPRPVELTEAGRRLHRHASAVVAQLREADDELDGLRAGTRGRLSVGSFQSVSVRVLPPVARALAFELPDVELDLFEHDDADVLLDRVARRELDASFVVADLADHDLTQTHLLDDPYVAIAAHGELPDGALPIDRLTELPVIGQQPSDMCQRRIDAGLAAKGIEPRYVFRSGDNAAVQAMARAGRGVALMPYLAVDPNDPGVTIHPLDPPLDPRSIVVVWRDGADAPPAVRRFVELAVEVTRTAGPT